MCYCNSVFLTKLLSGGCGWKTKEVQKLLFYEQYNILKMKTNTAIKYVPRNSYHSHALTSSVAIMIQAHQLWHALGVVLCTTCKEGTELTTNFRGLDSKFTRSVTQRDSTENSENIFTANFCFRCQSEWDRDWLCCKDTIISISPICLIVVRNVFHNCTR